MKTRKPVSSGLTAKTLLATLLAAVLLEGVQLNLHAQLVADGVTVYYSSPIDISPSDLIVGTNGGKTVLYIVPLGAVTNANGTIGLNATSTNNQVHVENSGVVWQNNGNLNVGAAGSGNQLVVSNGGLVVNIGDGYVGVSGGATNNLAVVTGTGSLWKNGGDLTIGNRGSGNQLVVSNGAVLTSTDSSLGYSTDADNNLVTVTGPNSQWRNTGDLIVGFDDNTNNQVVIRDGGLVMSSFGGIGSFSPSANRHSVLVADPGSLWTNSSDLNIGETGSGNQLVVTNGGMVQAARVYVGSYESSTNNRALVDGGNLIVTNFDGTGMLDIRRGTNVFNAGLIQADRLWLTNSAGFFEFNGGTFITGGGTVNNGQDFVVGASGTQAAVLDVLSNAPLTLNHDFILGANNAANNQLLLYGGGVLSSSGNAFIGLTASDNLVVVDGAGSSWSSSGNLLLGINSAGNQLAVAGGGVVANASGILGDTSTANNNRALVRDAGSLWINSGSISVGSSGAGNQLVVSNGAVVASVFGSVGVGTTASNNLAVVAGPGSLWTNSSDLIVGSSGKGNQLIASDGGTVRAANAYVGAALSSTGNRVTVSGGNLIITNSGGTGTLNILRGTNVLNAGLIQTDNLQVNNGALSQFEFNGGTLITGGGTVNNGSPFVVGASGTTAGSLDVRSGAPLNLNDGFTLGANTAAAGNQLLLTNGGTLSVTGESSVGVNASNTNNLAVVSGPNSRWSTTSYLRVGYFGTGNQLVVSDGGTVISGDGFVGSDNAYSGVPNVAVVSGAGSLWTNSGSLWVGYFGVGNQLAVSNGGLVVADGELRIGDDAGVTNNQLTVFGGGKVRSNKGLLGSYAPGADSNRAIISGPGSLWSISSDLSVGEYGSGNQLVVTNGGTVQAAIASVGLNASSVNNRVTVDGGNLVTGTLDIRRGTNVLNAGLVVADKLLLTNSAGFFEFNGGTLTTRGGMVNNGQSFIVGAGGTTAAILNVQSNAPLTLNNSFTLGANTAAGNQLHLTNGGTLSVTGTSYVGADAAASNNLVTISGPNSLWTNNSEFYFGYFSSGNQLVVSDGGALADGFAYIGLAASSSNNVAVVTGPGSTWTNSGDLRLGGFGGGNQLVVSDGGMVVSGTGYFAANSGESSNNLALVTGPNSRWLLNSILNLGYLGGGSQLVVSNAGTVQAPNAYVGVNPSSTDNRVTVAGGNLIVTNSGGTGTLDIRRGTNVLNAGLIQADSLLLNNGKGFFEFNGGTLLTSGSTVVNGSPLVVGNGSSPATLNLNGNGLHTFIDGLLISTAATLKGNGTVDGPLTVQSGGNLSPGASVGLLVLNNSPALQGSVVMEISKAGATLTNDHIQITASLTYGGNLVVSNLGPDALSLGNSFPLFSATSYGGAFTGLSLPALNSGLMWTNQLLIDGSIAIVPRVQPSISGLVKSGTNLVFDVSGGTPGGAYTLLTATNVALPLSIWTTNSTGNFDWLGNLTLTNAIDPATPEQFFTVHAP